MFAILQRNFGGKIYDLVLTASADHEEEFTFFRTMLDFMHAKFGDDIIVTEEFINIKAVNHYNVVTEYRSHPGTGKSMWCRLTDRYLRHRRERKEHLLTMDRTRLIKSHGEVAAINSADKGWWNNHIDNLPASLLDFHPEIPQFDSNHVEYLYGPLTEDEKKMWRTAWIAQMLKEGERILNKKDSAK